MATLYPPPSKRQKTAAAALSKEQQAPEQIPEGSIRVQFVDRSSNESAGPAVSIPLAHATTKNLELLLNSLQGRDDTADRLPYRFFYLDKSKKNDTSDAAQALGYGDDIYSALIKNGAASTEEELVLQFAPQAVFRVKAATRCSAAISGHGQPILCTQFAPDSSSRMVSGSGDNTARIMDCLTGTPVHTLKGHTSWVLVTGM